MRSASVPAHPFSWRRGCGAETKKCCIESTASRQQMPGPSAMNDSLRKRPSGTLAMARLRLPVIPSLAMKVSPIQGRLTATGHRRRAARMARGTVGNGPAGSLKGQTRGPFPPDHHRISLPRRRHSKRCDRAASTPLRVGHGKAGSNRSFARKWSDAAFRVTSGA